jgi:tRNA nucleotidyltransferase (CCA-adding enzyme)
MCVGGAKRKRPAGHAVHPTKKEQKIFSLLLDVVNHAQSDTVVRVAGGWVRDRLLGKHTGDIDVALDNRSGAQFAQMVNDFRKQAGESTSKIGVILANPDQSKHLETATMSLMGCDIDFVNLRTEKYQDDSRIPEMAFGTATEDAERRDFTINALFYNVNDACVEDFTGQGCADLDAGIIRTPLDPSITFLDDPLRVLRAVRFASRFNFQLVPELRKTMMRQEVKTALCQKVKRER